MKKVYLLLNDAFSMTTLHLVSRLPVHLASFVIMLPRQLKYSTLSSCFWSIIMCTGGWMFGDTHYLSFYSIHFHSIKIFKLQSVFRLNRNLHSAHILQDSAPQPLPTTSKKTRSIYTKCSNRAFVLMKMGIMMPETCWDRS